MEPGEEAINHLAAKRVWVSVNVATFSLWVFPHRGLHTEGVLKAPGGNAKISKIKIEICSVES